MTYLEQLQHPLWQKRKTQILIRDKFSCKSCRSKTKTLHVHHIFYFGFMMAWDYPNDLLITLCMDCHNKERERDRFDEKVANALKLNGFLVGDLLCLATLIHDQRFSKQLIKKLRKIQHG